LAERRIKPRRAADQRLALLLAERLHQRGHAAEVFGQNFVEHFPAFRRQADRHHAAVLGIRCPGHQTVARQRVHQPCHGRARHAGAIGQLGGAQCRHQPVAPTLVHQAHQHAKTPLADIVAGQM
jgi:hypothetical protein